MKVASAIVVFLTLSTASVSLAADAAKPPPPAAREGVRILSAPPAAPTPPHNESESPLVKAARSARTAKSKAKVSIDATNLSRSLHESSKPSSAGGVTPAVYGGTPDPISERELLSRRAESARVVAEAQQRQAAAVRQRELEIRANAAIEESADPAHGDQEANDAAAESLQQRNE